MSMSNFSRKFSIDLDKFLIKTKKGYSAKLRKATINGFRSAIMSTRVNTGHARINWKVSLGDVNTNTVGKPKTTPKRGTTPNTDEFKMSGVEGVAVTLKRGLIDNIYISNNLDYIGYLNWLDDYESNIVKSVENALAS